MPNRVFLLALLPLLAAAQSQPDYREILQRLDRLESQNQQLLSEIRTLREQLTAASASPVKGANAIAEERLAVEESRTAELSQSKVEADHRLPVSLTGMMLFNAYLNGHYNNEQGNTTTASLVPGTALGGATLRQSVVGLKFRGPEIAGGGTVSGSLYMDFFAGTGASLNQLMRIRIATLDLGWKHTTLSFGQDKPIIAPREPDSLAQVGVSPLTGAGNLWLWQPQVRVEQRFDFGEQAGLRAQLGVFQTSETGTGVSAEYLPALARARPGVEGRFEFWAQRGSRRLEVAPGFHLSNTHLLGQSIPSRIFSLDWLLRPAASVDFSGAFFHGENVDVLGGLRQGVSVFETGRVTGVHAYGGWAQLAWRATPRLTFHVYGGQQDGRNADLLARSVAKNQAYAANIYYLLGSNVLASFEASQVRTTYLGAGTRLNPHYDLALAYLF